MPNHSQRNNVSLKFELPGSLKELFLIRCKEKGFTGSEILRLLMICLMEEWGEDTFREYFGDDIH
jgi:hypothetical protein